MELNSEGFEMLKQNIPMVRAQRVDEKNGVLCLVLMNSSHNSQSYDR